LLYGKGTVTFRRYRVRGKKIDCNDPGFLKAIRERRFQELFGQSEEGESVGWITPEHLFDTEFDPHKVVRDPYVTLCMRTDRKRVPAQLFRAYVQIEELAYRREADREAVPVPKKREIREEVRARLLAETPPSIAANGLFWNVNRGILYFEGRGGRANETLRRLFRDTFQRELAPLGPEEIALDRCENRTERERVRNLLPARFEPLRGSRARTPGETLLPGEERSFLGDEFLTWLWFRCDRGGDGESPGEFALPGRSPVAVLLQDYLVLTSSTEDREESILRRGVPAQSPEASIALGSGKKVARAKLLVARRQLDWSFVLHGRSFDFQSLRPPRPEAADAAEAMLEKIGYLEEIADIVDGLYRRFLALRLSAAWEESELSRIRGWVAERLGEAG
jgi:recombination associated protein RdgC